MNVEKWAHEYSWESSYDFQNDMSDILDEITEKHGSEFKGTIEVRVKYIPEEA